MIEENEYRDNDVDRRDETMVIRHPGFDETVEISRDIAAERRMHLFRIYRLLWSFWGILEILLLLRFILRFLGANPESGFVVFMYSVTNLVVGPFNGMLEVPTFEGAPLEISTLVAMMIYFLVFVVIAYGIYLATDRPNASAVRRYIREETPGGKSVVRTTISNGKL